MTGSAAVAACVWACAPASPPPVAVAPPVPRPTSARPTIATCPGGLLCEAPRGLGPWRLPVGCEPRAGAGAVQTCWLEGVDGSRVIEFFRSRYPHLQATPGGALVEGLQQRPPPQPGGPPQPVAPALRIRLETGGVAVTALPGDP